MADNRNFVNKFANEGGGDIFVEDAKLSESTSTTTMTTEGVLLKGTDGAFYEIDKSSLSEVIRAELGNILADNSKDNGTSVNRVPTLNSTGNALGASSLVDFASVLGLTRNLFVNGDDLNSKTNEGWWYTESSAIGQSLINKPSDAYGNMVLQVKHLAGAGQILQFFYTADRIYNRYYYSGSWGSWNRVYNDGILNDNSVLTSLASALGVFLLDKSIVDNRDANTDSNVIYCKNGTDNWEEKHYPTSYGGFLFDYNPYLGRHIQVYFSQGGSIFWRTCWGGEWTAWKTVGGA